MKIMISLALLSLLGGCGCTSHCIMGFGPGNPLFESTANYYDSRDPCQTREFSTSGVRLKPAGHQQPSFCGAASNRIYIYNNQNQSQGYVRTR